MAFLDVAVPENSSSFLTPSATVTSLIFLGERPGRLLPVSAWSERF